MLEITGGVDTHRDNHVAAALDQLGRLLGTQSFPASRSGYRRLLVWLSGFGQIGAIGVEGTGSYGAGLARHLRDAGIHVVEVDRPDRRVRRRQGKSDPVDAVAAARAVQAGTATGVPKARDGVVESIRTLRVVREGAVKAHTAALNALQQLVISAPDGVRAQLQDLPVGALLDRCARMRPDDDLRDPSVALRHALRRLARRCRHLAEEIADADRDLKILLERTAPALLERMGVGIAVAAQLLVTAGDNPARLSSDASFAALCGASPLPASSGRTNRHRLNRGGDRAANCALFRVVLVRMRYHQPTRDYVVRRTAEGLSKREIMRCLKRYVARELLPLIRDALEPTRTVGDPAIAA
jgi:transposase